MQYGLLRAPKEQELPGVQDETQIMSRRNSSGPSSTHIRPSFRDVLSVGLNNHMSPIRAAPVTPIAPTGPKAAPIG